MVSLGSQAKEKDFASPERRFRAIGQGILGFQFWDLEGGGENPLSLDSLSHWAGHSQIKDRIGPSRVLGPA